MTDPDFAAIDRALDEQPVNTGGPAFPTTFSARTDGMSLRDYFAGQALITAAMHSEQWGTSNNAEMIAAFAYRLADAMLAAREK
jgi:hypothetical protein